MVSLKIRAALLKNRLAAVPPKRFSTTTTTTGPRTFASTAELDPFKDRSAGSASRVLH